MNGAPLVTATDLLKQARDTARNGDYGTARRLRSAALARPGRRRRQTHTPLGLRPRTFVPGPVITTAKRARRIIAR